MSDLSKRYTVLIKRLFKWVGVTCLMLLLIGFMILAGAANPIINAHLDQITTAVSQKLGRPISISSVDIRAFPWLYLDIEQVQLDDLLTAHRLKVSFSTWQALISFGEQLQIDELTIEGVTLHARRNSEGRWNFDQAPEASQSLEEDLPREPQSNSAEEISQHPENHSSDPQHQEDPFQALRSLSVGKAHIKDFRVLFTDEKDVAQATTVEVVHLNLLFPRLNLDTEIKAVLEGSLLKDSDNFSLSIEVGPYDHLLTIPPPTSDEHFLSQLVPLMIKLRANSIDLSPLSQLLKEYAPELQTSRIFGSLDVEVKPKETVKFEGEWNLENLLLNPSSKQTVQVKFSPHILMTQTGRRIHLDVDSTNIQVEQMSLSLHGGISHDGQAPELHGLGLESRGLTLDRLVAISPELSSALPPQSELSGPLTLRITTSGDQANQLLDLKVDLNSSKIDLPNRFIKTSNEALQLTAQLHVSPTHLHLNKLTFDVGPAQLHAHGSIPTDGKIDEANFDLRLLPTDLNALARLLPSARKALKDLSSGGGQLSSEAHYISRAKVGQTADFKLSVGQGQLDTPTLKIIGSGQVSGQLSIPPNGKEEFTINAELSDMALRIPEMINKSRGVPMRLSASVSRQHASITCPQLNIQLANLSLTGSMSQTSAGTQLSATLPRSSLGPALKLFDAGKQLGPDLYQGKLGFTLSLDTSADPQEGTRLNLQNLSFSAPKTKLTASLQLSHTDLTSVQFIINASQFNLDRLFPPSKPTPSAASSSAVSSTADQSEQSHQSQLDIKGSISIKQGTVRGTPFRDLKLKAHLTPTQAELTQGHIDIFGGEIKFMPINIKLTDLSPWQTNLEAENIQIEKAIRSITGEAANIEGRLSGGLTLAGSGLSWPEMSDSIQGQGRISLRRGALKTFRLRRSLFASVDQTPLKLLSKRQKQKLRGPNRDRLKLKTLSGAITVKDGSIHMDQPLKIDTPQGPIETQGKVGLDGSLNLDNQLTLSAQQVSRWIGRRISTPSSFPVRFKLGGSLAQPKTEAFVAGALFLGIAAAYGISTIDSSQVKSMIDQAQKTAKEKVRKVEKQAKRTVRTVKRKAKEASQEAQQKADDLITEGEKTLERKRQSAEREVDARVQATKDDLVEKKKAAKRAAAKKKQEAEAARKREQRKLERRAKKLKGLLP